MGKVLVRLNWLWLRQVALWVAMPQWENLGSKSYQCHLSIICVNTIHSTLFFCKILIFDMLFDC